MKKIAKFLLIYFLFGTKYKKNFLASYESLKKQKKIEDLIYKIKESVETYLVDKIIGKKNFKHSLNLKIDYSSTLNQFIFKYLVNNIHFNDKLIFSLCLNDAFYYPLPKSCLKIIEQNGVKINYFKSKLLWELFIFSNFFFNIIKLFYNFINIFKLKFKNEKNSTLIYLDSMPYIDFDKSDDKNLLNFYEWLANFLNKNYKINNKIVFIHDNKKILDKKNNYTSNFEVKFLKEYFYLGLNIKNYVLAIYNSFLIIFKYGFKFTLILDEIIKYKYIEKDKSILPHFAFFNNGNMTLQPMWSKLKNKLNEEMSFVFFYSTNIIPVVDKPKDCPNLYGFRLHSWDNYIFLNDNQRDWVEFSSKRKFKSTVINDYIPFEGKNTVIPATRKKRIAIFDVPPRDIFRFYNYYHMYNIYSLDFCTKFFRDVTSAIVDTLDDVEIFYKIKRNLSETSNDYKKLIFEKKKENNFHFFSEEISAQSLINSCDALISIPYTSTAYIGEKLKKPSIYYFPGDKKLDTSYFSNNIDQINNKDELILWLKKNL